MGDGTRPRASGSAAAPVRGAAGGPRAGRRRHGLVLGKFMPVHAGHLALIRFAAARCERLTVLVCTQRWEPIDGALRFRWVRELVDDPPAIEARHFEEELPYRGLPSVEVSRIWGERLRQVLPTVDTVFTSEAYGDELGAVMGIEHVPFEPERLTVPIAGRAIREAPLRHWDDLPEVVRPYFARRICLFGAESVGKSTLAEQLAEHFRTVHVPEVARDLIPDSRTCRFEDLRRVAEVHARAIVDTVAAADRLMFVDTDLLTTRVYARFLFGRELEVAPWIEAANRFDLHLLCADDLPHVQDGTRLGAVARPALQRAFDHAIRAAGVPFETVRGHGPKRLARAITIIEQRLGTVWR